MNTKLLWATARSALFLTLLWLASLHLRNPYPEGFQDYDEVPYGRGNATDSVRKEILDRLHRFQEGYRNREVSQAEGFVRELFSEENTLTLGTFPREIFHDRPATVRLIRGDWTSWGDCNFLVEGANVSSEANIAWFATIGYADLDLSRFVTIPLRLTGVLVKEEGTWRFQQLQFQTDYGRIGMFYLIVSLILLSAGSVLVFTFRLIQVFSRERWSSKSSM